MSNNSKIYRRQWLCESPAKANLILVHGLGEHCGRYNHVADALNRQHINVYSLDLPGHGCSEGLRGYVTQFSDYCEAIDPVREELTSDRSERPLFLLGHSMGGLISSRYLLEHQQDFDGCILSGPAIQSPQQPPRWQLSMVRLLSRWLPKVRVIGLDTAGICRDPKIVENYLNDPLVSTEKLTARLMTALFDTMNEVRLRAPEIEASMLLMHGTSDTLTSYQGSQFLHDHISSEDKTLKLYTGLYHEIFNEPESKQVLSDMLAWINQRIAHRSQSATSNAES